MRIEDLKQMKVKLLGFFANAFIQCILVKQICFCISPNIIILTTKTKQNLFLIFFLLSFPLQAYLKHLKKQQKELNSLKKKHAKVVFCVYVCFILLAHSNFAFRSLVKTYSSCFELCIAESFIAKTLLRSYS